MDEIYNKIKTYYDSGLWNKDRVINMVNINIITKEEYKDIVGEEYEEQ